MTPAEELLTGLVSGHGIASEKAKLSKEQKQGSTRVFSVTRERLDLRIEICTLEIEVEKAEVIGADGEKTIVSASTQEFGPKGMMVTWNFLSQVSILVGQYGMPMNRLSVMLSTPDEPVRSERIVSYFHYVAKRLAPVYMHNVKALANAAILSGDDTQTRTLEVKRGLKNNKSSWEEFETPKMASQELSSGKKLKSYLCCYVGSKLAFVSPKKQQNKKNSPKTSFNTTIVHGREIANEPTSTIVLFRSHFGSFADLVCQVLEFRDVNNTELTLVSDLASTNNVKKDSMSIIQAGCTSHARRRFAKYEGKENDYREIVMSNFGKFYQYEQMLDLNGRNLENTQAVRTKCAKPNWEEVKEMCEHLSKNYSSSTTLGEAARYVLNNFAALTHYLNDPKLPHTNDLSERLLRPEKQIQAAACFRNSIEGRAALDIVRSIIQTCSAAKVNAAEYIDWFLRQDEEQIEQDAQKFTPYMFSIEAD